MRYDVFWEHNVFNPEACKNIISQYSPLIQRAITLDASSEEKNIRKSNVVFVEDPLLKQHVAGFAAQMNRKVFGFNLDFFYFDLQFTEYLSEESGHYDWHTDMIPSGPKVEFNYPEYDRKLSLTILLSDPDEFEGGDLELIGLNTSPNEYRRQGTGIAFASFTGHRVTPVTKGKRHSLVAWIEGPQFQ